VGEAMAPPSYSLNDLLGIKVQKKDDLTELLYVEGGGRKHKQSNDFFGDMNL
jgi:hypothetical protein